MSISLLMEITERVAPPRVLALDRPLGYPLGEPGNIELQRGIMLTALDLLSRPGALPIISRPDDSGRDYSPDK